MKVLAILLTVLCLVVGGASVFVWSGFYNIAANDPHWPITEWFLGKVRQQSISAHSKGIIVPLLKDPNLANVGFSHYHAMCRLCHNAPGYSRTEIARGLYPAPPDFTAKNTVFPDDRGFFWIVRNGIKMTGMPAFGSTHSEEDLRGTVLFAKRVPSMRSDEYDTLVKASGGQKREGHHH